MIKSLYIYYMSQALNSNEWLLLRIQPFKYEITLKGLNTLFLFNDLLASLF